MKILLWILLAYLMLAFFGALILGYFFKGIDREF